MASLDSQGEIVPIEIPNPEETQIWKGENEPVCSRYGNGLIDVAEKFEFEACPI